MKKSYETPSVEKICFNYRDQVVAASGTVPTENGNIFQSNQLGSCYSAGEAIEYLFAIWLGQCDVFNTVGIG